MSYLYLFVPFACLATEPKETKEMHLDRGKIFEIRGSIKTDQLIFAVFPHCLWALAVVAHTHFLLCGQSSFLTLVMLGLGENWLITSWSFCIHSLPKWSITIAPPSHEGWKERAWIHLLWELCIDNLFSSTLKSGTSNPVSFLGNR